MKPINLNAIYGKFAHNSINEVIEKVGETRVGDIIMPLPVVKGIVHRDFSLDMLWFEPLFVYDIDPRQFDSCFFSIRAADYFYVPKTLLAVASIERPLTMPPTMFREGQEFRITHDPYIARALICKVRARVLRYHCKHCSSYLSEA